MARPQKLQFDEIGYWSELKLEIVKSYAQAYTTIFSATKQARFYHLYIDAFAGAGLHVSRKSGEIVPGSPLNALNVKPPFREYHLIDLNPAKVLSLRSLIGGREKVFLYEEDSNRVLVERVLPLVRYEEYRRALCLLDPYGLHLNWDVIAKAGEMRTVDIFLNFPTADMNRNVFWRNRAGVHERILSWFSLIWKNAASS